MQFSGRKTKMKKRIMSVISMMLVFLMTTGSVSAAWDGYAQSDTENTATELIDMNSIFEVLKTGGNANSEYTQDGCKYSIEWDLSIGGTIAASAKFADWSDYDKMTVWIYSEKATNDDFGIVVDTERGNSDGACYYMSQHKVDWEGWKAFKLPFSGFTVSRAADWAKVTRFRLVCTGWSMNSSGASAKLYIGKAFIEKASVSSLELNYDEDTIAKAKAAMIGGAAIYKNSANAVADGEVKPIDPNNASAKAYDENGIVMTPAALFENYFGAEMTANGNEYQITCNGKTVVCTADSDDCTVDGVSQKLGAAVKSKDGLLYLPCADIAQIVGLYTVTDKGFAAVSTNEAVLALKRIAGVNELSEIVSYMAAYIEVKSDQVTNSDFDLVKSRWKYGLVGSEQDNDMTDEDIAAKIESINDSGQAAWDSMIKKSGATELFHGITTTQSAHMTTTYGYLQRMALAYGTSGAQLYKDEKLRDDIIYGLDWMYKNRYGEAEKTGKGWRSTSDYNWWDWKIGSPAYLVNILMIMEDDLSTSAIKNYLSLFDYLVQIYYGAGSNALNTAKLAIGSSLLQGDAKRLLKAQAAVESVYLYQDNDRNPASGNQNKNAQPKGEGFYTDGSYIFHILHAMNATYGLEQFQITGPFVSMFKDSIFEVRNPQADNMVDWIYNAFDPLVYQGGFFRMVKGRYPTGLHTAGATFMGGMLDCLDLLDDEDYDRVAAIIKSQYEQEKNISVNSQLSLAQVIKLKEVLEGDTEARGVQKANHVYYNEDKVSHKTDNFGMGVSMSSSRIFNYESINGQNLTGWYISDGMTEYYTQGDTLQSSDTYWNSVNPYRLPGVTADTQKRKAVSINGGNAYLSSKDFVGATNIDGKYGTAAMYLESYHNDTDFGKDNGSYGGKAPAHDCNLEGKKAWFMFDNEVVCLGSGINASNGVTVETTVDNKLATQTKVIGEATEAVKYDIESAAASATPEPQNTAENTIDGQFTTKWAGMANDTITWDIGSNETLGYILLSFQNGTKRTQNFKLEVSADEKEWKEVFNGSSSGTTDGQEVFTLGDSTARFVRLTNYGNSTGGEWISLTTAEIYAPNADGTEGLPKKNIYGADKFIVDNHEIELTDTPSSLDGPVWAHFENVGGYYFPNGGNLFAGYTNSANSFMELWFDHGVNPVDASYAYTLLPGLDSAATRAYAINPDTEILINTDKIQAVREKTLGVTGIVFWEAGTFEGVTADKPMIVMIKDDGSGSVLLSACDPTQLLTEAHITLDGRYITVSCDELMTVTDGSETDIEIDFSNSDGRTFEAALERRTAL